MKKIAGLVVSILMIINLTVTTVFAAPFNPNDYTSVDLESDLCPVNVQTSRVRETPKKRGSFFSAADLIISDEGKGDIGAFAKAYMESPVEEVYITVYLDRWDATADRWRQVTYYDAEFYAEDYPEGLSDPSVSLTFTNQAKGYYYRLRGVFGAVADGQFEGFSPVTDGILIE